MRKVFVRQSEVFQDMRVSLNNLRTALFQFLTSVKLRQIISAEKC
jgi:CHAD domain-containing protein